MDATQDKLKVLMLPWLAHGHASPFLELSKRLIDRSFFIYFCSTPIILSSIKEKITETQSHSIELVDLHLPSSPELPPHRHTTKDLPTHLVRKLKDALDMAAPSFSLILDTVKPDLVIYDTFQPWAATISSSRNIPAVQLFTSGASMICLGLHMMKHPEREFPCRRPTPRYYKNFEFRGGASPPERKKGDRSGFVDSVTRSSDIILIKSFEELEGEYYDYLSILSEKKVVPVGPLVESPDENGDQSDEIMEWLDKKEVGSTVLVSFGSECFLKKEEIEVIALGLELSNVNFLWVLRFPAEEQINTGDMLPKGFLERVGERGKVWDDWAPQVKILAHPSIGGFMTHCGWSSVMESMGMGVPIIGVPMHLDQPFNASMVEEAGAGVEVWRDETHGGMKGEEIAKTIRKVVVDREGEAVTAKAKEFSVIMRLKEEERMTTLVKELMKLCKERK